MLLGQAVQDLRGLSPRLRREVADAQYVDELHASATNVLRRIGLRAWGATTVYGQSIARLSIATGLLILTLTTLFFVAGSSANSPNSSPSEAVMETSSAYDAASANQALAAVLEAFFGLGSDSYAGWSAVIIVVARVAGFVILGLWISIAAQMLARLSAE
jgi:hypothetical protein